ncbi:hypothetical protein BJ322DRAFT_1149985 [Thelephora terrestris]|uniref:Uncharacterized protein n=1 Tax=Thelephora terrestris TaxID=56493 RepID=A0A9P6HPV9_9AGAM|nr:hypothetical protein BJ322DRAFT_1149985 [Thelephora terrestris]
MAGRKRAAPEDATARPTKTAKTSAGRARGKTGPKTNLSAKTFKSQAHPLHISITHTPPPVTEDAGEKASPDAADPGFLASFSLQPSSFSTGTYGWKGSKRVTIEVDNPDTGEKEKLQVQLSFNATVLGSKGKDGEDEEPKEEKKEEDDEGKDEADKGDKDQTQE